MYVCMYVYIYILYNIVHHDVTILLDSYEVLFMEDLSATLQAEVNVKLDKYLTTPCTKRLRTICLKRPRCCWMLGQMWIPRTVKAKRPLIMPLAVRRSCGGAWWRGRKVMGLAGKTCDEENCRVRWPATRRWRDEEKVLRWRGGYGIMMNIDELCSGNVCPIFPYIYTHLYTCRSGIISKTQYLTFQHVEETLVCSFPEVSVVDSTNETPYTKGVLYLLKTSCYFLVNSRLGEYFWGSLWVSPCQPRSR